ncbi:MAG: hypothetical protein SPF74_01735 [Candidatus Limivicinus sp.]|nr:hypothetical protein [Candidatus Limivicinus sp.]
MWKVFASDLGVEKHKIANKTNNIKNPCHVRVCGCFPQFEVPTTIATKNIRFIY